MNTLSRHRNWVTPCLLITLLLILLPSTASAHSAEGTVGGFVSGFGHPLGGLDHIVAMVAVGLWGAFLGRHAMWTLPVVFPVVMAFGGAVGVLGVPIPHVEIGIALSGIVLVALRMRAVEDVEGVQWTAPLLALWLSVLGVFRRGDFAL